mmetsp:Transcript_24302/g.52072  ORF Transcript_24302/g.52072 Transcript_24302/m.52072 type:complete len:362 (+) Transcript_24302:225-1310(+)|eukprot:CAMPEP_0172534950 /NCGR_PEP_ID=MMETSP1067-20121228/7150_1 /TAXON_ID=265564 ORGANISM="Thalassiosira punctigera, Strain Tpunct2005C2" /NCGR_SAMPLE_ID=MMETSP1067 /ASSEMBLY_ACC=CAM_ASM_000444 /LENGTH=361 /DNA_ID=CAMNT_0013319827 /DNA_START=178 /DNA_END=1263 /DNA_ORIENTATION=-
MPSTYFNSSQHVRRHHVWDLKCFAAAACFLTSNILFIVHGMLTMRESKGENELESYSAFSMEKWQQLDPIYIKEQWRRRDEMRPVMMTAALFGAMAWFWLMVPIVQAAWVLSKGGTRAVGPHCLLAGLAICGGIIELLARLLTVGMTNAASWMAKDFNLENWTEPAWYENSSDGDGTGWRVLEMIAVTTQGMLLWVDAFEAMALFGIMFVIFYSVATEPRFKLVRGAAPTIVAEDGGADEASGAEGGAESETDSTTTTRVAIERSFSKCFIWFGLLVGLLAGVDFLADCLRFVNWKVFGTVAMTTNVVLGVVFLPLWLLCLGYQLPLATHRFENEMRKEAILARGRGEEEAALKSSGGEFL